MKKATILDKSTISRQFTRDTENYSPSSQNNYEELSQNSSRKQNLNSQVFSQEASFNIQAAPLNPHLSVRSITNTNVAQSICLGVLPTSYASARRHMYSKAADRSAAINERIERMARKWTDMDSAPCSYDELAHPSRASQVITLSFK